jgi:iron complex transport system permease protein
MKHRRDGLGSEAEQYHAYIRGKVLLVVLLAVALLIGVVAAVAIGSIKLPLSAVLSYLLRFDRSGQGRIVWDVRLPRVLAALLVGASLSLSGTMMQSVLSNPLASPYTLGLSSAAAFGASVAIVLFGAGTSTSSTIIVSDFFTVAASAFTFSLLSTATILLLTVLTTISAQSMVLAGIAIGSIFSAGLTLMQYLANSVQLSAIVSWTFGDLGRSSWRSLLIIAGALGPVLIISLFYRWDFNAMDSGEESAKGLGVRTGALRIGGMLAASLLSAVVVSYFGTIAFIGLLGPHIARRLFGSDHRFLLVASPLIGALVLLVADTLARTILTPMVLPVGILTSLLGGPLFIYLLIAGRQR